MILSGYTRVMKLKNKPLLPAAAILLLVLSIACQSNEIPAPASASQSNANGASPVPEQAQELAQELAQQFARDHGFIEKDWDNFHLEFDTWREGLVACDPSAAQQAFRGFASNFNDVNEQTLSLSRPTGTRGLADKLIEASQGEAAALRRLRDRWQPGNDSLLEAVATKRVESAVAQKGAEDKLADLQEGTDTESLDELKKFSEGFDVLQADWEEFHGSYESLKDDQTELEPAAVLDRIDELIGNFDLIVAGVKDLPAADKAEDLADALAEAADSQKKGLIQLKGEIEELKEGSSSDASFDAFDEKVQESQDKLKGTKKELKGLTEDGPGEDTAAVQDFALELDEVLKSWNGFYRDFDNWMDSEGGCDRSEVIQTLGEMSLEFGRLADRARDLPTASYLRPMGGLIVEAAEGEEEALRVLRNTWRPFTADVYKALDRQRADAGRLRRQASVGVQELLDRFQVSLK